MQEHETPHSISDSDWSQSQMFSDKIETSEDESWPENNDGAVELEAVEPYQDALLARNRLRPKRNVNYDRVEELDSDGISSPILSPGIRKEAWLANGK